MIIIYLILVYLIIMNINFINLRKHSKLYFEKKFHFFKSFVSFLVFILYFVVFIRLMNLFRDQKTLDLKYYIFNYDLKFLFLLLIFLYFSRKNFMFFIKMDCYRLHYYLMNNDIESNWFKPYYNIVFNNYFSSVVYFSYPILYYVNIIVTTITYSMIFIDLFINSYTLCNSLILIPYYSLFKLIYNLVWYFECKHNALNEYFVRQHNYMLFLKSKNIISDFIFDSEVSYLKYEREVIREL